MADNRFHIEKEIEVLWLKSDFPPFASYSARMKGTEITETLKIAEHLVHGERAIARIKQFKIPSGKIRLTFLASLIKFG